MLAGPLDAHVDVLLFLILSDRYVAVTGGSELKVTDSTRCQTASQI